MKVCVLGNSHAASLKLGWDEIATRYSNLRLTFFVSRGERMADLRLQGRELTPLADALRKDISRSSGGLTSISLDEYDIFVVYAMGLHPPSLDKSLSSAVVEQACRDIVDRSLNVSICREIRTAAGQPVFIGHNPQKTSDNIRQDRSGFYGYSRVYDAMERSLRTQSMGLEGVRLMPHPETTLFGDWFTKHEFSVDAEKLANARAVDNPAEIDLHHMNGKFGRLWLERFLG